MKKLYAFFPVSSTVTPGDKKALLGSAIIYLAACAVLRVLGWALGWIPLAGWLLGTVFSVLGLYCVAGLILSFLKYFDKE